MKLIINDNRIAATATDDHQATGAEQAVITAPEDFDLSRMGEYRFEDGELIGPGMPLSFEAARSAKLAAINAKVEAVLSGGFTVPVEASTALGGEVIQTRDADDRINWLVSQASYSTAVAAGQGEVMEAEFRTLDNQVVIVSYAEGLNVLLAMAEWGRAAMRNSWALKDAALAAEDQAALDAIDVEAGWP